MSFPLFPHINLFSFQFSYISSYLISFFLKFASFVKVNLRKLLLFGSFFKHFVFNSRIFFKDRILFSLYDRIFKNNNNNFNSKFSLQDSVFNNYNNNNFNSKFSLYDSVFNNCNSFLYNNNYKNINVRNNNDLMKENSISAVFFCKHCHKYLHESPYFNSLLPLLRINELSLHNYPL